MTDINEFILNRLDRAEEKQEKRDLEIRDDLKGIGDQLSTQSKLLDDYNQSLREHMRRTRLLEEKVEPMHKEWSDNKVVLKHKMKTWKKIAAAIGVLATVIGAISALYSLK